jgi:hypothetical protein
VIFAAVAVAALGAGLYLTTLGTRTDGASVSGLLVAVTGGLLSAIHPRAAVIVGTLVGLPISVVNVIRSDSWASFVALGVALAAAFVGAYLGIILRRGLQPSV